MHEMEWLLLSVENHRRAVIDEQFLEATGLAADKGELGRPDMRSFVV